MPHLLLQPLLENTIFCGIEPSHRPGVITVLTKSGESSIFASIKNPYGTEPSENTKPHKGNSMVLRNLKECLTLMYDTDAKIKNIQSDGPFRAEIILPYRKKSTEVSRLLG